MSLFIAPPQMPRSLDVSHWQRTDFVWFSLLFKGAPCGLFRLFSGTFLHLRILLGAQQGSCLGPSLFLSQRLSKCLINNGYIYHQFHKSVFLFVASLAVSVVLSQSCFGDKKLSHIPASHLSQNKTKPWVFGHKGNPKEYQENTIEGFLSLITLQADGLAADTFLTNDGQLVLFHDENAMVNFLLSNCLNLFVDLRLFHRLTTCRCLTF